jgi:hypothetical protein
MVHQFTMQRYSNFVPGLIFTKRKFRHSCSMDASILPMRSILLSVELHMYDIGYIILIRFNEVSAFEKLLIEMRSKGFSCIEFITLP